VGGHELRDAGEVHLEAVPAAQGGVLLRVAGDPGGEQLGEFDEVVLEARRGDDLQQPGRFVRRELMGLSWAFVR
jgi:hypothetical protein